MSPEATPPSPPADEPPKSRTKRRVILAVVAATCLGLTAAVAVPVMRHYEIPPFSEKGEPLSFDHAPVGTAALAGGAQGSPGRVSSDSWTLLPTGPRAAFTVAHTLDDGTHIGVVTLHGAKSGYTGQVWVWAPKAYQDPKFANSGFPVLIALPGGPGYQDNYWMDPSLKLEESISAWYRAGKSKPFLLAMPVLNPGPDTHGIYWDGSDIPGQPKMGTWLTEDVPNLMRANFRTLKSRNGWGYMGSSSGGFVGLKSVLKYPERFKAVIASGPDIVPDSPLWNGHPKEMLANNPEALATQLIARNGPDVYLAFQVGTRENRHTMADVKAFIATYGRGPVHTYLNVIQGGKHDAYAYVPAMGNGPIEWISAQLQGPTPSP